MAYNALTRVTITAPDATSMEQSLRPLLDKYTYAYMFIVYYKNNTYKAVISISSVDTNNTYGLASFIWSITCNIAKHEALSDDNKNKERIVYFVQPPLNITLVSYDPLCRKLAYTMSKRWSCFTYDDLLQDCRLCICDLYNRGYYVNNWLIQRTFVNKCLQWIRKHKASFSDVSMNTVINTYKNENTITYNDVLEDKQTSETFDNIETDSLKQYMYQCIKDFIVENIGQRGYEQLLRDYGNKTTTNWSRLTVRDIKRKMKRQGITKNTFQ